MGMAESAEAERFQGLKETGDIEDADMYYDQGLSPEDAVDIVEDPEEAAALAAAAEEDGDSDTGGKDDDSPAAEKNDEQTPTPDSGAKLNPVLVEQAKARGFTESEIALCQSDAALAVAVLRTNRKTAEETLDKLGKKDDDGKFTLDNRENYDEDFAEALEGAINGVRAEIKPLKEANERLTQQLEHERASATAQWLDNQLEAHGDEAVKLFGKDMAARKEGSREAANYIALLQEVNRVREIVGPEASSEDVLGRALAYKFDVTQKKQSEKGIRDKLAQRQTTLTQRATAKKPHDLPKGRERAEAAIAPKLAQYGLDDGGDDDDRDSFL
jgi:hypothetical protein